MLRWSGRATSVVTGVDRMYEIIDIAEGRFGKKVYATVPLIRDTLVVRFTGRRINFDEALRLGEKESFALQVGADDYVYLDEPARFFNHSCDPNCGVRPDLTLVALRAIAPGEELTYDYSTTMLERKWTMDCKCRTDLCRGVVMDFDLIPEERREFYLRNEVVQDFIVRSLSLRKSA
jgi:uncharacterized protein